jgi:hypothetical protein
MTGYRLVRKPSRIYMENTNLVRAVVGELGLQSQEGAARETFFAHQIKSAGIRICSPAKGISWLETGIYLRSVKRRKQVVKSRAPNMLL